MKDLTKYKAQKHKQHQTTTNSKRYTSPSFLQYLVITMKTSIIAVIILASQANGHFLRTRSLSECPASTVGSPVACGPDYMCVYHSECEAKAAGYNPTYCIDHVEHSCPAPGSNACPLILEPVQCKDADGYICHYDNECVANAAGLTDCTPASRRLFECQVPNLEPMKCGPDYSCAYNDQCAAESAGFDPTYCLPVGSNCPTLDESSNACPPTNAPVKCQHGSGYCFYPNECAANAAGVVGCTAL